MIIREVLRFIDRPLNVLLLPGGSSASELIELGVRRVSVGSALAWEAYAGFAAAPTELLGGESHDYYAKALGHSAQSQSLAQRQMAASNG